jgi:serine/threonine protein kinase
MLSAVIYNQGKELFHKDLRPENLMVEDHLLDIPTVKINDFCTAVEYKPKDKKVRKSRKMTFT